LFFFRVCYLSPESGPFLRLGLFFTLLRDILVQAGLLLNGPHFLIFLKKWRFRSPLRRHLTSFLFFFQLPDGFLGMLNLLWGT
jgi:hypothetical protein